jgi:hypothetical protein
MPDPLDTATDTTTATSEGTQTTDTAVSTDAPGTTSTDSTDTTTTTEGEGATTTEAGTVKEGEGTETTEITYEPFAMPEGVELDQAAVDRAIPVLKELGLDQDKAQKLVGIYASELQAAMDAALTPEKLADYVQQFNQEQSGKWAEAVKADPEIGGAKLDETHALVRDGIAKFGSPALKEALDSTGLGNHPELVRMFRNIGLETREDRGGNPPSGGGAATLEDRMYPGMKQ